MSTRSVAFRGYAIELPVEWFVEAGEGQVLAGLPESTTFSQNIVLQVVDETTDPVLDLHQLAGAVVLSRSRSTGALPAEEIVFGYPLPVAAVTAVQLVGDPTPEGRLLVTYSADATRFADDWPTASSILRSIRRTS